MFTPPRLCLSPHPPSPQDLSRQKNDQEQGTISSSSSDNSDSSESCNIYPCFPKTQSDDILRREVAASRNLVTADFIQKYCNEKKARKFMLQWTSLYAAARLSGSNKTTVESLEEASILYNHGRKDSKNPHVQSAIPHYTTVNRTVRRWLFHNSWLRSETVHFPVNVDSSGARVSSDALLRKSRIELQTKTSTAPVVIILPSEYARADLATPDFFNLVWRPDGFSKDSAESMSSMHGNIYTNLGKNRELLLKSQNIALRSFDATGTASTAFAGSTVQISVTAGQKAVSLHPQAALCFRQQQIQHFNEIYDASTSASWILGDTRSKSDVVSPHTYQPSFSIPKSIFARYAVPGDHLTVLSPVYPHKEEDYPIFFGLIISSPGPPPSQKLLFFTYSNGSVSVIGGTRSVDAISLTSPAPSPTSPATQIKGTLNDGTIYYVYPFLLYCDDFNEATGKKGSAGGCYMLPMGLPLDCRRSTSAVRVLGVTGPGVSTNHVLRYIARDIVQGCTSGFRDKDPYGNDCVIFLDFIGFVSDYPACSHVLDVMGHISDVPCHVCTFPRGDKFSQNSQFGYNPNIHSSTDSTFRTSERTKALRTSAHQGAALYHKRLGLKSIEDITETPLLLIEDLLREARDSGRVPLNAGSKQPSPVVPATIDCYRSTFVGVDHLLQGLAKDALDNAFCSLPTDDARHFANHFIVDALKALGLKQQKTVYNHSSSETYTMGMSERFSVILVAPTCFQKALIFSRSPDHPPKSSSTTASDHQRTLSLDLVNLLSNLISATYHLPRLDIDGMPAVQNATKNSGMAHFKHLQQLSKQYARKVDELVRTAPPRQRKGSFRKKRKLDSGASIAPDSEADAYETKGTGFRPRRTLDNKPNLHRLVEAYEHTIPLVGHARQVAELAFEATHQTMKRGLEQAGGADRQLDAMLAALGNDWKSRLHLALSSLLHSNNTNEQKKVNRRFLLRLLFGRQHVDSTSDIPDYLLLNLCQHPLLNHLRTSFHPCFSSPYNEYSWVTVKLSSSVSVFKCASKTTSHAISGYPAKGSRWTSSHQTSGTSTASASRDFSRPEEVTKGSVLQACYQFPSSTPILSNSSSPTLWIVLEVFLPEQRNNQTTDSETVSCPPLHPCALVYPVSKYESQNYKVQKLMGSWFLPLTAGVRKVGLIHNCTPELCSVNFTTRSMTHGGPSFLDGGSFSIITRENGYPPRAG